MLPKKEHLKNSSMKLILLFKYCRYLHYSNICEHPLPDTTCFDLPKKCHLKLAIFTFPIFLIITLYLLIQISYLAAKKNLVKSIFNYLWYSSMFSYIAILAVVNYMKKDIENVFVSASDHRIFLWNLSFKVYLR